MTPRDRIHDVRLYLVFTPGARPESDERAIHDVLTSGAIGAVQLRVKDDPDLEGRWRRQLRDVCAAHDVLFLVNDDPRSATGADGVHVGEDDPSPAEARRIVGPDRLVGLSTHDPDEVRAARDLPVDYVGLGPCFPTDSKALTRTPGGPALVAACLPEAGSLPVFPIGGITLDNAPSLIEAGADRLAVGAGILASSDPKATASRLRDLLP